MPFIIRTFSKLCRRGKALKCRYEENILFIGHSSWLERGGLRPECKDRIPLDPEGSGAPVVYQWQELSFRRSFFHLRIRLRAKPCCFSRSSAAGNPGKLQRQNGQGSPWKMHRRRK